MNPCKGSLAHSLHKGHSIRRVRKRYLKRICCLLLRSTPGRKHTHTHTHTPTHDALSILKKLEQCTHTLTHVRACTLTYALARSINPCPVAEEKKLLFKSITASFIAVCVCVCVSDCVSVSVFKFLCALFVCIEGKQALFKNNIAPLLIPQGPG